MDQHVGINNNLKKKTIIKQIMDPYLSFSKQNSFNIFNLNSKYLKTCQHG